MADAVEEAAGWARALTQSESRGPGDMAGAWRRLESRYGVPANSFWALRYRRPKTVAASIYLSLRAAYRAECERQTRRLQHELEITRTIAGSGHPSVRAAEAVLRKAKGEEG